VIVENVVAFEVAAAILEKYVGTSLEAIKTSMSALHDLNRERLSNWERKVGLSGSASVECSPE
jgi:chorismate synthase